MTNRYYDAGGSGSNTSPYDTPAKAATTLAAVLGAVGAADEIIYVKSTSNEALASGLTFATNASYATAIKPQRFYSVADLSDPTTLTFGAKISFSAEYSYVYFNGNWDFNGIDFDFSVGTSSRNQLLFGDNGVTANIHLENCKRSFNASTSSDSNTKLGVSTSTGLAQLSAYFKDLTLYSRATATPFNIGDGKTVFNNLILSGSTAPTTIFKFQSPAHIDLTVKNSDLSGVSWTNLFDVTGTSVFLDAKVINCKMPASYTLYTGTISSGLTKITLINATSGDVNYQYAQYSLAGSIITIDSIVATTNPIPVGGVDTSDIFTSSASCGRGNTLSREYFVEVADNTTVTPFVELLRQTSGSAALNNDEVYITAETVIVAGTTQGSQVTSHPGALATPSACSAGTTAYTGDGYATERTHRIETASLTTRQAGWVKITVHLAKASTAIYIGSVGVV